MKPSASVARGIRALSGLAVLGLIGGIIACGSEPSGGGGGGPAGSAQPTPQPSATQSAPPSGVPPATPYPSPGPSLNPQPPDDRSP